MQPIVYASDEGLHARPGRMILNLAGLATIILLLSAQLVQAQEYFYYYKGKKQPLELNTEFVYIVTSADIADAQRLNAVLSADVSVNKFARDNSVRTLKAVSPKPQGLDNWSEVKLKSKLSPSAYFEYMRKLKANGSIRIVSPFFKNANEEKIGISQYFLVKLKNAKDLPALEKMAKDNKAVIVGQNKFMPLWYTLSITPASTLNALETANRFYESGLFMHAEPDFLIDDEINAANDTFYADQWGLNNTGQFGGTAGIDINAEAAWEITKGSRDIIVAVLDQGIEMNHPDLQGNIFGTGFDSESGTTPSQVLGDHGTACAGIIGAIQDNNTGVSGVAPNIRLMSVSNSLAGTPLSRQKRADGINWAWQNGAHIISNSWGSGVQYAVIDDAIDDALAMGRGGLGTIVLFSSGNNNTSTVGYPANSNPDIIAVGAMSNCAQRKNPASCDGENWWGSQYGTDLDVVAPGVLIYTTDRQGASGYTGTDYVSNFNGTSSACPMAAGVAALMLSVNPCLTHDQVEDIIEQTAQKVGGYGYAVTMGRPNGTWDDEMGYGLVDANAAVIAAQGLLPVSPGFDLFSKDRPFDTGVEPNPDAGPMYITEDIWVRKNMDGGVGHQNPEYKLYSPNGLYIKVTNRGTTPSNCANLAVYFSKASTGLTWPTNWNNYFQVTSSGNILHGDLINTVQIPALMPGASYTAEIPWFPPNPADFDSDIHHFCLLSRIVSGADPMFDEQVFVGVGGNVRKNNNIVWKNVSVYDNDADASDAGVAVYVRGTGRDWTTVNLGFLDRGFKERVPVPFFSRKGAILIRPDEKLLERIKQSKLVGSIKFYHEKTLIVTAADAQIAGLRVHPKESFLLHFKFSVQLFEKETTLLDVVQFNEATQAIEGGERFIINFTKDTGFGQISAEKQSAVAYPNPTSSEVLIRYTVDADTSDVEITAQNIYTTHEKVNLLTGKRGRGEHTEKLSVRDLKKGVYAITIKVGDKVISERLVIE